MAFQLPGVDCSTSVPQSSSNLLTLGSLRNQNENSRCRRQVLCAWCPSLAVRQPASQEESHPWTRRGPAAVVLPVDAALPLRWRLPGSICAGLACNCWHLRLHLDGLLHLHRLAYDAVQPSFLSSLESPAASHGFSKQRIESLPAYARVFGVLFATFISAAAKAIFKRPMRVDYLGLDLCMSGLCLSRKHRHAGGRRRRHFWCIPGKRHDLALT